MNFKPIYLRWLIEHIDHYIFISEEAKELEKKLMASNLNNQDLNVLSDYYNRFVELFDSDPFRVHFGIYNKEKGIITKEIEYYLDENKYGIKLPLQFFSDYGIPSKCSLLESSETKKEEINKYYKELNDDVNISYQRINLKMKSKNYATHSIKYIVLLLCVVDFIYSVWFYREEITHFNLNNNIHLWMAIAFIISIILIIFGLLDIPSFIRSLLIKKLIRDLKRSEMNTSQIGECINATYSDLRKCYSYKIGGGE
ncbi:MAG: hypothetical protein ACYDEX_03655 [Mobilitalea sp.]